MNAKSHLKNERGRRFFDCLMTVEVPPPIFCVFFSHFRITFGANSHSVFTDNLLENTFSERATQALEQCLWTEFHVFIVNSEQTIFHRGW